MSDIGLVDLGSDVFARRFANLLVATRATRGCSLRSLARADGELAVATLKAAEAGNAPLDEALVSRLAGLYGCDLGLILPSRLPVSIRAGIISAGGVAAIFDPNDSTSLLTSYLQLVRQLRRQRKAPAVTLRRDDVEVLAGFLQQSAESVVDRLAVLAGAARPQRLAMAALFASGAAVIGLVGTALAGGSPGAVLSAVPPSVHPTPPTVAAASHITVPLPTSSAPLPEVRRDVEGAQPAPATSLPAPTVPPPTVVPRHRATPVARSTPMSPVPPAITTPTTTTPAAPMPAMIDTDLVVVDVGTDAPPAPPTSTAP